MIQTTKKQLKNYTALNPYFPAAFAALERVAEEKFVKGHHEVDGDNIYINALEYNTHGVENAQMEAHTRYIDVMWMLSGDEKIGVCPVEQLQQITKPYDEAGDAFLSKFVEDCTYLRMKADSVCIFFPEDGHAPGLDVDETTCVRKLIAKVKVV